MKRFLSAALAVLLLLLPVSVYATEEAPLYPYGDAAAYWYEEYEEAAEFTGDLKVKSAYLTDYGTGRVLYAFNENERRPIASVTKIMTTLLVFEALDDGRISYGDTVTVSDYAASMGGSQVYLEPGEQMELRDMLKALIVSSANDATVALAEHIAGSVETFTSMMNNRAHELGMDNTHFANPHGLDDENHYSSAKDVAIMTRELLSHPDVTDFTTIWMDTIRGGEFGLANTNKLIRFYNGANGMKTGFTNTAGFCLSGTALRDGLQLIAVGLGGETSDDRFAAVKKLLDFGFANYCAVTPERLQIEDLFISGGTDNYLSVTYDPPALLLEKGKNNEAEQRVVMNDNVAAPVSEGDRVGTVYITVGGEPVAECPVYAQESIPRIGFWELLGRVWREMLGFL